MNEFFVQTSITWFGNCRWLRGLFGEQMRPFRLRVVLAFAVLALQSGCAPMNSGSKDAVDNYLPQNAGSSAIQIDSDPPGAEIFVMGERIGTTPAMISPKKIFPTTYPKDQESLYGRVLLTKDGCADLIKAVSTKVMNTGLHARLECADQHPTPTSKPTEAVDVGGNVEQRLMKIRDLLDKGLITDEEAKRARDRIINNL